VLLPFCDASILPKVLDPNVPYVWLIDFWWPDEIRKWIEQHLPPVVDPTHRVETVQIRRLEMDATLSTGDFLRLLPFFAKHGVDLIQATRPLPPRFYMDALKPESKAHVFHQLGIVLEFHLPIAHEHALVTSTSRAVLEAIVAAVSGK